MPVILQDTREKNNKHNNLLVDFEQLGFEVVKTKNVVGDYILASKGNVSVDIKQDMSEITNNLIHDHERFRNECILAQKCDIKLYILIEEETSSSDLENGNWKFKAYKRGLKCKADPKIVAKIMKSMSDKYGVKFYFTSKQYSAINVLRLLGYTYNELKPLARNPIMQKKLDDYMKEIKNVIHS
jgi:ribosome-associated protein